VSAFIEENRDRFGVGPICSTLGVSASAYHERRSGRRSAREISDERLLAEIRRVHADNYEAYGSRRVWKELLRRGETVARCTVERLMAEHGIQGAKRRGRPWRTTTPDPEGARRPDLVDRDFTAPAPDRLWVADFTYLRTWEGVVLFSFVIDVFSRRVVGWRLASHMRTDLVLDALRMALGLRSPGADVALVHHSDRGSQYTSAEFTRALEDADVLGSLGSTGDAYDNALAESFVDSFKTELIADRVWRSAGQAEPAIAGGSPGSTTTGSTPRSATSRRSSSSRPTGSGPPRRPRPAPLALRARSAGRGPDTPDPYRVTSPRRTPIAHEPVSVKPGMVQSSRLRGPLLSAISGTARRRRGGGRRGLPRPSGP